MKKNPREGLPSRGFSLLCKLLKNAKLENVCQGYLADKAIPQLLEKVDTDLAQEVRKGGCLHCPGILHSARYRRKPRGEPEPEGGRQEEDFRQSFCCNQEGCRKRHTPPSVRFLGRRVYAGLVVVLVSAMNHGLKPQRVQCLREALGIDRRTLERWRQWWLVNFVQSSFWQQARARFMPPLCQETLPLSLCLSFAIEERRDRLLDLLRFLSPITAPEVEMQQVG